MTMLEIHMNDGKVFAIPNGNIGDTTAEMNSKAFLTLNGDKQLFVLPSSSIAWIAAVEVADAEKPQEVTPTDTVAPTDGVDTDKTK